MNDIHEIIKNLEAIFHTYLSIEGQLLNEFYHVVEKFKINVFFFPIH